MRLITAHRILIGVAIAFFIFFALLQLRLYFRAASGAALVEAVVSGVVAIGLVFYYRTLSRWGR